MTYKEFCLACQGYQDRIKRGLSESWWTAHLGMFAYHDPKKFPSLSKVIDPPSKLDIKKRNEIKGFLDTLPKKRKIRNK